MVNSRPRELGGSEPVRPIGWRCCPLEHPSVRALLEQGAALLSQLSRSLGQPQPEGSAPARQRRLCVVCGGELQGHGNATAHAGECRRRRRAGRAREKYRSRRPAVSRAAPRSVAVDDASVLAVLQVGGPLHERGIARALGVKPAEGLNAVTRVLNELLAAGHARQAGTVTEEGAIVELYGAAERWSARRVLPTRKFV